MGKYSNIAKNYSSLIAGIKYKILFIDAERVVTCPALTDIKTADDHYLIADGNFVLVDPLTDKFNVIEFINRTGELKWKSLGSPGNLKSMLELDFDYAGISGSFAKFIALAKNDNLIMIVERTDCSGQRFIFGGCCLPAQMVGWDGTLGKKPEDDIKTNCRFEAYADGLPVVLASNLVIPIETESGGDFDENDFDENDFNV